MTDRNSAVQFYNQAAQALNDHSNPNRLQHAYHLFSSSVIADPSWAESHYQSGNNAFDMQQSQTAIAFWRRALECNPEDQKLKARILTNIGWQLNAVGKTDEALQASLQAIELVPQLAAPHLNLGEIYGMLDQPMQRRSYLETAFALAPHDPDVTDIPMYEFGLSLAYFFNREWQQGFKHYESRFAYKLKSYLQYPYPKWDGSPNQQLFVVADQGLGDTLSFARFLEQTCRRSKYVHAYIQSELMTLFQRSFLHINNLNIIPMGSPFQPAYAWTTFMSLPEALKLTDEEFVNAPHIKAERYDFPINWKVPGRKLHIGIAWGGSPLNVIDKHRNIPVTQFLDLYRVPGIQLYSLQKSARNQEMHDAGCMALIRDLTPYIQDVSDTINLVRKLDLVICCESALGHICALADVPCIIPYSYLGRDWRIGNDGTDMIWTPKHKIFRQGSDMQWAPVFDRIADYLKDKIGGSVRS